MVFFFSHAHDRQRQKRMMPTRRMSKEESAAATAGCHASSAATASNLSSCRLLFSPRPPPSRLLVSSVVTPNPDTMTMMMTTQFPRHQRRRRPWRVYVVSGIGRRVVPPSFCPPPHRLRCCHPRLSPACERRRIGVVMIVDVPGQSAHIPVAQSWRERLSSSLSLLLSAVECR